MEFFDVIKNRGSYRGEFEKADIPQEDLRRILDAGIRAPSGYNLQTTTFYAVTNETLRHALAEIFPTKAVKTAPVIIVVTSKCVHGGDHDLQFETEDYAAATLTPEGAAEQNIPDLFCFGRIHTDNNGAKVL